MSYKDEKKNSGIILIPYKGTEDSEEVIIQIGDKKVISKADLIGAELEVSDRYFVKIISKDGTISSTFSSPHESRFENRAKEIEVQEDKTVVEVLRDDKVIPKGEETVKLPSSIKVGILRKAVSVGFLLVFYVVLSLSAVFFERYSVTRPIATIVEELTNKVIAGTLDHIEISPDAFNKQGDELFLDTRWGAVPGMSGNEGIDLSAYRLEVKFISGKTARVQLYFKNSSWANVYSAEISPVNGIVRFDPKSDKRQVNQFNDFSRIFGIGVKVLGENVDRLRSKIESVYLVKRGSKSKIKVPTRGPDVERVSSPVQSDSSGMSSKPESEASSMNAIEIPISSGNWKAQNYRDSQGISRVSTKNGTLSLSGHLKSGSPNISKGETYLDFADTPALAGKRVDLSNKRITVSIYIPKELIRDMSPQSPNGVQLFIKDSNWKSQYGTWHNISKPGWMDVSYTTIEGGTPPLGWSDSDIDISNVRLFGIKVAAGGQSNYSGSFTMHAKNIRVEDLPSPARGTSDNVLDLRWIRQDYVDSQAVKSVKRIDEGLELNVHAVGADPNYSKGEIYLDLNTVQIPGFKKGPQDLSSYSVTIVARVSRSMIGRPFNGIQIFSKSVDGRGVWSSQYGKWMNVSAPDRIEISYTPTRGDQDPQAWYEDGFDPTKLSILGIKIGTGGGSTSTYDGTVTIESIKINKINLPSDAPKLIQTPYLKDRAESMKPVSEVSFKNFSGTSLYYKASTFGYDIGGRNGFSSRKGELNNWFKTLKGNGVNIVRLFTFTDLRNNAIKFDRKGKPTGYDKKVVADLVALVDAAAAVDIKLILPLFDFLLADGVKEEGDTGRVGEHPNLLTNPEHKKALIGIFRKILIEVKQKTKRSGKYDTILAFEPMNEPELTNVTDHPFTMPYTQKFVADFASLFREVFPDKPVSFSTFNLKGLSNWIHLLKAGDIMQIHWYSKGEGYDKLDTPRGKLNIPNNVKVMYGEAEPGNIHDIMSIIHSKGYEGVLFWHDNNYRFLNQSKKLRDFKRWRASDLRSEKETGGRTKLAKVGGNGKQAGEAAFFSLATLFTAISSSLLLPIVIKQPELIVFLGTVFVGILLTTIHSIASELRRKNISIKNKKNESLIELEPIIPSGNTKDDSKIIVNVNDEERDFYKTEPDSSIVKPVARSVENTLEVKQAAPLFELVESTINNNRTKTVTATNKIVTFLNEKIRIYDTLNISELKKLKREITTLELRTGIENVLEFLDIWITYAEDMHIIDAQPAEVKEAVGKVNTTLKTLETDSVIAATITMARKAKRKNEKLIIGFETSWIPGFKRGNLQHNALNPLVKEIESLGDTFRNIGLDNVIIVHESAKDLAEEIIKISNDTATTFSNVVVLASNDLIESNKFDHLRTSQGKKGAFLAGINPEKLVKAYEKEKENVDSQLNVKIIEMLSISLELAMGKDISSLPIVAKYDKELRRIIFLPVAEPIDYNDLRERYRTLKQSLVSA